MGRSAVPSLLQRLGLRDARRDQLLGETRFVVIDSELTGLDRKQDAIIALSAVRMVGTRILLGETFYSLVNPRRELVRDNVLVHRLRSDDLVNQPTIDLVLQQFLDFMGEDVVVGHFVELDLMFLQRDAQAHLHRKLNNRWLDTQRAYLWMFQQEQQFLGGYGMQSIDESESNLFELAHKYRIPVKEAHHALYDAFTAAQLWQRLQKMLPELGVRKLGDAVRIAGG